MEGTIRIRGARTHNLQGIDLDLPRDRLIVVTGLSGSGKSSLAFDTLHAEGQRRYVESLALEARALLEKLPRPDVDYIEGLPPTLALGQARGLASPRSTVATATEIWDHLRLLYARCGTPRCPTCGDEVHRSTVESVVADVTGLGEGTRFLVLAPLGEVRAGPDLDRALRRARRDGFVRVRIDEKVVDLQTTGPVEGGAGPGEAEGAVHRLDLVIDRLVVRPDPSTPRQGSGQAALGTGIRARLAESCELGFRLGRGRLSIAVGAEGGEGVRSYSEDYACPRCGVRFEPLEPRHFSWNSREGACPECQGLGTRSAFDRDLVAPDSRKSLAEGAIVPLGLALPGKKRLPRILEEFAERFGAPQDAPIGDLSADARRILFHGTRPEDVDAAGGFFEGVLPALEVRYRRTRSARLKRHLAQFMSDAPCPACGGERLAPPARAATLDGRGIGWVARRTVVEALAWADSLHPGGERGVVAAPIIDGMRRRLRFLAEVGVSYLTLDRPVATLSAGEAQRIRLATQIGASLAGVCYVLDEPTVGLHPRDTDRLLAQVRRLVALGSTAVVVEHDERFIRAADHVVDLGPGAGARGGRIVYAGDPAGLPAAAGSETGAWLSGRAAAPRRPERAPPRSFLRVIGAAEHNLKGGDAAFPVGRLTCVTGVSGSGKTTLVREILFRAVARSLGLLVPKPGAHREVRGLESIDRVVEVDATPIGRSPRSTPATVAGVFGAIRRIFASLRESRVRGYGPARFSFNARGGRCEACRGLGWRTVPMHFLPDVTVRCDACGGRRYGPETLDVRYRGKSVADVLDLTIDEARSFFSSFPRLAARLGALAEIGLGYLTLGRPARTLSGGESQRIKLAAEIGPGSSGGGTLYVLDEPTTGLHPKDIACLLGVLDRLVESGNTVVVVEHNLDVVRAADWVIDLGPEGGDAGGEILAAGPPAIIAACARSHTGRALAAPRD